MTATNNHVAGLRNILLRVSYDGTNFCGWQRQQKFRSVQGEIESALQKMHGHSVDLHGSGRTDSGVHAAGQAANFYTDIAGIPAAKFVPALNSLMSRDVRILSAVEVPESFHARFTAKSRTYRYFIHTGPAPLATQLPYVWAVYRRPDITVLNDMAACLRGEIDCTSFAAAKDASATRNRYVYNAVFFQQERDTLVFEITANAFLWKMVRSVTGTLLSYEEKGFPPRAFHDTLAAKKRITAGPTAPPQGLFLWNVAYY